MAGFRKILTDIVTIRLIIKAEMRRLGLDLMENLSLIRTSKNKAMSGPKVKEAIFNPISTKPSEIFPEK